MNRLASLANHTSELGESRHTRRALRFGKRSTPIYARDVVINSPRAPMAFPGVIAVMEY